MKKIDWKSKKTIIIIVVAVVLVLALLSVGIITFGNYREAAEVQDLKEKIAAFPDVDDLTAEDSDALSELIEAYNALSDEEKSELAEESAKLQNASNKIEQITGTKPDVTMPAEENTTSENTTVSFLRVLLIPVPLGDLKHIAPLGGAVFRTTAAVLPVRIRLLNLRPAEQRRSRKPPLRNRLQPSRPKKSLP